MKIQHLKTQSNILDVQQQRNIKGGSDNSINRSLIGVGDIDVI
ncbi:MAG: hypothetical protein AAGG75_07435 [Bacteroidota bacterium]